MRALSEGRAVSAIVTVGQYEEGSQFADAIGQWKILRNIHPQYPGIDFEISQLEKRREQQAAEEKKSRLIEQIDRAVENGAYARAVQFTDAALAEFPQDSELIVLEKITRGGLERIQEAERLFEDAKKMRAEQHFEQAVELLQRALKLDERNVGIRNALVSLFIERAQSLLDEDWRKSESLAQAAAELDEQHPALDRLRLRIAEAKRKDGVIQCIAGVRELQRSGDLPGALRRLEDGLTLYPDDPKLLQHQASLQNTLLQEREQKPERKAAVADELPKNGTVAAGQSSGNAGFSGNEAFTTSYQRSEFNSKASIDPVVKLPDKAFDKKFFQRIEAPQSPAKPKFLNLAQALVHVAVNRLRTGSLSEPRKLVNWLSGAALVTLLCIGGILTVRHLPNTRGAAGTGSSNTAIPQRVAVTIAPPDAVLTINGSVQTSRTLLLDAKKPNDVTVSRLGYKTWQQKDLLPRPEWRFNLEPEPLHIQVLTAERSGTVLLDGKEIWNLQGGDLLNYELTPDAGHHSLTARNQTGELLNVSFEARPGMSPLVAPIDTRDLIVASTLGNQATVFSGSLPKTLTLPGQAPQQIAKGGALINMAGSDPEQAVLMISDARGRQNIPLPHGNAPTLCVSLNANPNLGFITISTPVQNAQLFFDGRERNTRRPGFWRFPAPAGPHEIRLVADGYTDENRTIQVEKGREISQAIAMNPASAALSIEGGIAGTEVLVDDSTPVTVDATGNMRTSVSPGQHRILLRKEGYESLILHKTFSAGQTLKLPKQEVALKAFGTLAFAVAPSTAVVEYHSLDESEWHSSATAGSVKVKAGSYEVSAKADKYESASRTVNISPGEVGTAEIELHPKVEKKADSDPPPWKKYFKNPDQVKVAERNWLTGETGAFVPLHAGSQFTLTFLKPERVPLKRKSKRIEWHILLHPNAEVNYELDGQQLTRKTKVDGKTAKSSAKANAAENDSIYSVILTLDAHRIEVKSKDGALLDAYVDNRHDWSRAVVAIRGDQFFVVR
jgi:tetratricopeptide (TPR) repeat protein